MSELTPLRTPQARVMKPLIPDDPTEPKWEWPIVNRAQLGVLAGYTAISGTITRALDGLQVRTVRGNRPKSGKWKLVGTDLWEGNGSGEPHLGLIALEYIEEDVLDIDGVNEVNYRATKDGVAAYNEYIRVNGDLPPLRDKTSCTNKKYRKENDHGNQEVPAR